MILISLGSSFQSSIANLTNEFCILVEENFWSQNNFFVLIDSRRIQVIKGRPDVGEKADCNCCLILQKYCNLFVFKNIFTGSIFRLHLIS